MDENPYRAPAEKGGPRTTPRRSRIGQIVAAALIGTIVGANVLAPLIQKPNGPADPTGAETAFRHGAAYGGIVGLAIWAVFRALQQRT